MAGYVPQVGDIFFLPNTFNQKNHMTFVLAVVDDEALIANFTSNYPGKDQTVIIPANTYTYITAESCIPYDLAGILSIPYLTNAVDPLRDLLPLKLSADQIAEYRRGVHASPSTEPSLQSWCRRNQI